jgi:hypothetical protein
MIVDQKGTILQWFNSLKTHKCPGPCGGWVNYVSRATPAGRDFPDTYNTCVNLKKGGDLKVIYTIAGHEVQTRVGEYLTNLVKQFDIGISDLNCEKVEALFGFSPRLGVRDTVATAAFRILRSFLSSATNARKLIADRELVFAAAMARKPEFYKPFYRFCKHLGSWNHACRFYRLTRQAFRFEGVPESVINASQKIVMDRHRDIPAWANTYPVNDAEKDIASLEPKASEVFERRLPASDTIEEDIFRRYGKPGPPLVLAKDTYFIRTVLQMLNDTEGLFATDADKEEFLETIKKRGKISYHHGWDTMCRAVEAKKRGADPRFRALWSLLLESLGNLSLHAALSGYLVSKMSWWLGPRFLNKRTVGIFCHKSKELEVMR